MLGLAVLGVVLRKEDRGCLRRCVLLVGDCGMARKRARAPRRGGRGARALRVAVLLHARRPARRLADELCHVRQVRRPRLSVAAARSQRL